MPSLGVVVPAGGRGRRLAGHKLAADVAGRPLLDRTLDGLPEDAVIVCVGPSMPTDRDVLWVQETPVFGGPLAAVAAGEAALPPLVTTVLLVGGDMPAAGLAIPALLAAVTGDAGAAVSVRRDLRRERSAATTAVGMAARGAPRTGGRPRPDRRPPVERAAGRLLGE